MAQGWLGKTTTIHRLGFGLGAGITAVMLALSLLSPSLLVRLENTFLDFRFKLRGERPTGQEIVLVVIDEKSLKELGRWPWSRDKQAQLVTAIEADGAKVIGLDIIYTEAEVTEYLRELREIIATANVTGAASPALRELLHKKLAVVDTDDQFAKSLQMAKTVVLALPLLVPERQPAGQDIPQRTTAPGYIKRSEFMLVRLARSGEALEPHRATEALFPLKQFAEEAAGLGHVYGLPDLDGVTRYEYLVLRHQDAYYPSFGLEVARVYLGVPKDRMSLTLGEGVRLDEVLIPTDQKARMLINYAGRERSFQYVSATDVIHQRVPPGTFRDKAVLVGTAALATYDQETTPFSANFPGVEKNATVVENILHRQFLEKSVWSGALEVSMILLCGLTLTYGLQKLRALPGAIVASSVFIGYVVVAQYLFVTQGIWIPVLTPLLTIALTFMTLTVLSFMTKERQAKEIRTMFSSYVSPRIVEELIKSPTLATLGGQRKALTMLFADLVNFTTFSEKHSAEDVVTQLNEYLGAMTEVVFRWNGTLDKFVGDEMVVFWGAPLEQPDHAELAIKCALHMRKRLGELQEKWKTEGKFQLDHGIGINTGTALVGNIGAEGKKMDYTMIGDQVNLAARFQGLTRKFGCPIVITESTAGRLKSMIGAEEKGDNRGHLGHVSLRKLGSVKVKGKDKPVGAYAVESLQREELSKVEDMAPEEPMEMTEK